MNHCNKCGYTGELVDHPGCDYGAQKMTVPEPALLMKAIVRHAVDYYLDNGDTGSCALNKAVRAYLKAVNP
jgi:hypothetical protein